MSEAKRLLAAATPLPWQGLQRINDEEPAEFCIPATSRKGRWCNAVYSDRPDHDAALIVYSVNRLPDYEAAVDALERLERIIAPLRITAEYDGVSSALTHARAALHRLREGVTA